MLASPIATTVRVNHFGRPRVAVDDLSSMAAHYRCRRANPSGGGRHGGSSKRPIVSRHIALNCCVLAMCLAACSSRAPLTTSTIAFNISEDPHSLDPLLAQSDDEQQLSRLMFDPLIDVDTRGRLVPALATEVPTVANGGIS